MSLRRTILTVAPVLAVSVAAAAPGVAAAQSTAVVNCTGNGQACTARVSLAGGASNERVSIALPSSKMRLVSATPNNQNLEGAYSISDQASSSNGRRYRFTLNAVQSIPNNGALTLKFRKVTHSNSQIVRCKGTANDCRAKVSIAGGASNRRVVIQLPGADLSLASVKPSSPTLKGAYNVSHQILRNGNSEFSFYLSAPQSTPAGSYLTFSFDAV